LWSGYKGGEEMPLVGYATLVGVYNAALAGGLLMAKQSDRDLPERASYSDLVLLGIATHKLGRIISKDWVTSPLRAPFTECQESAGGGEVSEKSRGEGLQRAMGIYSLVHGASRHGLPALWLWLRFQTAYDPLHLQYLRSRHDFRLSSARLQRR